MLADRLEDALRSADFKGRRDVERQVLSVSTLNVRAIEVGADRHSAVLIAMTTQLLISSLVAIAFSQRERAKRRQVSLRHKQDSSESNDSPRQLAIRAVRN